MRLLLFMVFAGMLAAAGCARHRSQPTHVGFDPVVITNRNTIVTPDTSLAGKVVTVNPTARFVVLNFPIGRLPLIEQRMAVYRQGLKVGELKVTGPQREDNIVADIVTGEARVGDEVRDR